ncbi:hypothetical protein BKA64DRAFT_764190 [Cadophora sp. MPI-SDFR-AT-0126]|nr:hypothetical protein BKA64DRAFT_764190 [Leotiomycetes sp. MPI-SDFR-AT-0126]
MVANVVLLMVRDSTTPKARAVYDLHGAHIGNVKRLRMKSTSTFWTPTSLIFTTFFWFLDVCSSMAETTAFNSTDLDTMETLLRLADDRGSGPNLSWSLWNYVRPSIHVLNITLRLPLAFYQELADHETSKSEHEDCTFTTSVANSTWVGIWQAVCELHHLRRICIWLDHDGPDSWSLVKERLVFGRVFGILEAPRKLHPRISSPTTHYSEASELPSFKIERRFRQRYHCEEWAPGQFREVLKPDFPILYELGEVEVSGMNLEQIEDYERMLWNRGDDVERFALEMFELANVQYGHI